MFTIEQVPHIRKTKVYRTMDSYTACSIAEGFSGGEDTDDRSRCAAWQFLHDTGLAYRLQGWYGRTAQDLLAQGLINARRSK